MSEGLRSACVLFACVVALTSACSTQRVEHAQTASQMNGSDVKTNAGFAPTYVLRPDETAYARAHDIYESSPHRAAQGVYRLYGLVFVVVRVDTNVEKIRYLEGTAMLRAKALLRNAFVELPAQFTLQSRLLENSLDDDSGIYRYALVYRETDIVAATASAH